MSIIRMRHVCAGALFFALAFTAHSQTNQGIIAGVVVDESGAGIDGATVTSTSKATGSRLETTTSGGGSFRFPSLVIGRYDITASQASFASVTQTDVTVNISQTTALTITLRVGGTQQSITVQAEAATIETQSSEVGTNIGTKQVVELPLALGGVGAMRSPEAFVFLAPGTAGPGTASSNNGIFISKIGGGQNFGNEVLLDGASILRTENGSSFDEAAPSVEAIAEFRVLTSTVPAIYGRTTGGVETFSSKSGTNQFHGTAYDLLQNEDLNSNSWFNNAYAASCSPQPSCRSQYSRPIDKKNDYGTNLGGPVWIPKLYDGRNKSFFFFNWEQFRQNIGGTVTSTLPTNAQHAGDFSANLNTAQVLGTNPCTGGPVYAGQIFDPATTRAVGGVNCRDPFPNNQLPANRISPLSTRILSYLPATNYTGAGGVNYALSSSTPVLNTTYLVRVDQSITDKIKFFGTYDSRDNERYTGAGYYTLPPPIEDSGQQQSFITHYGRFGLDWIISPTLLNHVSAGYNRTNSLNISTAVIAATAGNFDWAQVLGLQGVSGQQFPIVRLNESVPQIGIDRNADNLDNGIRVNDSVTWAKGSHNLTFGGDFRNQLYGTYAKDNTTGIYNFVRDQTAATQALTATSGNGIASFLLGTVSSANLNIQGHAPRWVSQYYALFAQDDWKATNHLTLNLGLRWDVDVPRIESYNNTSNFNPLLPNPTSNGRLGALEFADTCTSCNKRWASTKYHDVGPRIGFAWNPAGGKTVIRGGYGIIYSPLQYTDFGGRQLQGYSATPSFPSPNGFTPAFNWDNGFPAYPPPPNRNPSQLNKSNPDYTEKSFGQPGIIQTWSFQVQRQVSSSTVASLGYVANRGVNLRSSIQNINNISTAYFGLGTSLNSPFSSNGAGVGAPYANFLNEWGNDVNVQQALRPYPQYGFIPSDVLQNIGQSTYHSLQASLERRFSGGLSLQASFTWSKTITDADSILPGINGGIQQIQDPGNLRLAKALSSQDIPYAFSAAPLWELPFGKGKPFLKSGVGAAILGGWQVGAVLRYQTGVPISFACAQGIPGWDNCIYFNRADSESPLTQAARDNDFNPFRADGSFNSYFRPKCGYVGQPGCGFADPNTTPVAQGSSTTVQAARGGAYTLGNFPRNNGDARNPNYFNEDFSAIRNFYITGDHRMFVQAKAEFLNAFNRHIWAIGPTGPNDPQFGRINATTDGFGFAQRVIQGTLRFTF